MQIKNRRAQQINKKQSNFDINYNIYQRNHLTLHYLVTTSFFRAYWTCEAATLGVSYGSRPPLQQESPRCVLCGISSIGCAAPEPACRARILSPSCIPCGSGRTPFPGELLSTPSSRVSLHGSR